MKKVLAALCFMCGAAIGVSAQETTDNSQDQATTRTESSTQATGDEQAWGENKSDYTEKERISASELPASVSQNIQGSDYEGWTAGETYRKEKDGETYYAVEMTKGSETKIVKFDAQGNKVKEKDKDKKHGN